MFLQECHHIKKKVVRHIHDTVSDFSYSSDYSVEDEIRISLDMFHPRWTEKKPVVLLKLCLQCI